MNFKGIVGFGVLGDSLGGDVSSEGAFRRLSYGGFEGAKKNNNKPFEGSLGPPCTPNLLTPETPKI